MRCIIIKRLIFAKKLKPATRSRLTYSYLLDTTELGEFLCRFFLLRCNLVKFILTNITGITTSRVATGSDRPMQGGIMHLNGRWAEKTEEHFSNARWRGCGSVEVRA